MTSNSRSAWGKQHFQGAPQGTPEQGLGRTTWDTNQNRPPWGRPVDTVPTKHFSRQLC